MSWTPEWLALLPRRRWTREMYERAAELGLFAPGERLELLAGEVVSQVSPQKSAHATAVRRAEEALRAIFLPAHDVRVQLPLALSDDDEPEPDLAVVPGSLDDYEVEHPRTALLVVEVADTTLRLDRLVKAAVYARSGIAEYWIVNLADQVLEVHRDPGPKSGDEPFGVAYREQFRVAAGQTLEPLHAPGRPLEVRLLFTRR